MERVELLLWIIVIISLVSQGRGLEGLSAGGQPAGEKKCHFFCFPVQAECFYLISTEQSGGCWVVWPEGCWALQGEQKLCFLNPCDTLNKEGSVFRSALMQGSGVSSEWKLSFFQEQVLGVIK